MENELSLYNKRKTAILKAINGEQTPTIAFSGLWDSWRETPKPVQKKESLPSHLLPSEDELEAKAQEAVIFHRNLRQARLMNTDSVQTPKTPKPLVRPMTDEELWKSDPKLRTEFIDFNNYAAYKRAIASGRAKVLSGSR